MAVPRPNSHLLKAICVAITPRNVGLEDWASRIFQVLKRIFQMGTPRTASLTRRTGSGYPSSLQLPSWRERKFGSPPSILPLGVRFGESVLCRQMAGRDKFTGCVQQKGRFRRRMNLPVDNCMHPGPLARGQGHNAGSCSSSSSEQQQP